MPKYKDYYKLMVDQNAKLFQDFKEVHDAFAAVVGKKDEPPAREKLNELGRDVVDVIRDWERRLCSAMGRGQFSDYSFKLAEKFWDEVRKTYPFIDEVGVKVQK